jgi:hypothetical protein
VREELESTGLDKWIAWAETRYGMRLDEADRERTLRLDAEARPRDRIQKLNERFKNREERRGSRLRT